MALYGFQNRASQTGLSSTLKCLLLIRTALVTNIMGRIWSYTVGADGTPSGTDSEITYDLSVFDAGVNATGSTVDTLDKLDPSDSASGFTQYVNPLLQGSTYTPVISCVINQRQTWGWQAYRPDQTIITPVQTGVTGPGLAFRAKSTSYTDNVAVTGTFEQIS